MIITTYLGIDPGKGGGLAWITVGLMSERKVYALKMPDTPHELSEALSALVHPVVAVLEEVSAGVFGKPGQRMGVSSAFSFGRGYGWIEACLACTKISFDRVRPQVWQQKMRCLTKGVKNVSKARAQELFPDPGFKITHANADALLIAEFALRRSGGMFDVDSRGSHDASQTGDF